MIRENWELNFIWYSHEGQGWVGGDTPYHKQCAICQRNFAIYREMDPILKRHPGWTQTDWSD